MTSGLKIFDFLLPFGCHYISIYCNYLSSSHHLIHFVSIYVGIDKKTFTIGWTTTNEEVRSQTAAVTKTGCHIRYDILRFEGCNFFDRRNKKSRMFGTLLGLPAILPQQRFSNTIFFKYPSASGLVLWS